MYRYLLAFICCVVLCFNMGCATTPQKGAGASSISYPLNASPLVTDQILGIDDPAGTWTINRFSYDSVWALYESLDYDPTGALDFTGVSSFDVGPLTFAVTGTAPTTVGQFRFQSGITGFAEEKFTFHNGTNWEMIVSLNELPTVTGEIITYNATNDEWEITTQSTVSAYASGTEADFYGTILNPQGVYDNDATNHALSFAVNIPAAFTITAIYISCDADPTTEPTLTFQHKAAGVGYATPTTIEAVTTTAGVASITSGIDDPTIPADTKLFITLSDPDDALTEITWQIKGDWD